MRPRRVLVLRFPRLASDRLAGRRPVRADLGGVAKTGAGLPPFAVVAEVGAARRLACLNPAAEAAGLSRGMALADARALCPDLATAPADPDRDRAFLAALTRWAGRFSPLVGLRGGDALALDITGVAHLWGDEAALVAEATTRLGRAGLTVQAGLADTPGAAHALARTGGGVAAPGATLAALAPLPPAALGLAAEVLEALSRLGLRRLGDLVALPRAGLTRRFGPEVWLRLDQALGAVAEPVAPARPAPHFAARLSLPEPIGLAADVRAALDRLLARLCARLAEAGHGACALILQAGRADGTWDGAHLRLARPTRDRDMLARLFAPQLEGLDAGFGFDVLRLAATDTAPLPPEQVTTAPPATAAAEARLSDLLTRLGNRLGFEALTRLAPAQSHIPERAFLHTSAAWAEAADWSAAPRPDRPLVLFPPEPIPTPPTPTPPRRFRWRGMALRMRTALGPERIAPEWWFDDPAWRSGVRDYWRIETDEGRRLWLFHTPQSPGWAVQGEFA